MLILISLPPPSLPRFPLVAILSGYNDHHTALDDTVRLYPLIRLSPLVNLFPSSLLLCGNKPPTVPYSPLNSLPHLSPPTQIFRGCWKMKAFSKPPRQVMAIAPR